MNIEKNTLKERKKGRKIERMKERNIIMNKERKKERLK